MKKLDAVRAILAIVFLSACGKAPVVYPTTVTRQASPSPTKNLLGDYHDKIWTFELDGENDGKISLTISNISGECHSLDQPFQIHMVFHNLTNDELIIPGVFDAFTNTVGYPNDIVVIIKPADQDQIHPLLESPSGFSLGGNPPRPSAYYKLAPNGDFAITKSYYIRVPVPDHDLTTLSIYDSEKDQYYLFPIKPGPYFLKFRYSLATVNHWANKIAHAISNRIEICIK